MSNLEKLKGYLRDRLSSRCKKQSIDANQNVVYIDSDIYSDETLENFLALSLSDFNQIPRFTNYTFDQDSFVERFAAILVEGATLYALASQALLERGREFTYENGGVMLQPPNVAEMLNTQYSLVLNIYWEKLKMIKSHVEFPC